MSKKSSTTIKVGTSEFGTMEHVFPVCLNTCILMKKTSLAKNHRSRQFYSENDFSSLK